MTPPTIVPVWFECLLEEARDDDVELLRAPLGDSILVVLLPGPLPSLG